MDARRAFMSYSRQADEFEDGRLVTLRKHIARAVGLSLGEGFEIWLDKDNLAVGPPWREQIDQALKSSDLMILFLTPSYLRREVCRYELGKFLEIERERGRAGLILPIQYMKVELPPDDELAKVLRERHLADWSGLLDRRLNTTEVKEAVRGFASQIVRALRASEDLPPPVPPKPPAALRVSPSGDGGGPTSIHQAVARAQPGDQILIGPGVYRETLVIDKPLELIGPTDGDAIVEGSGAPVIRVQTNFGLIRNLTVRQLEEGHWPAVDIVQGYLLLEDCRITSKGRACVAIRAGADPRLRNNKISAGTRTGVLIYDNAQGNLADNEISGHTGPGVEIMGGAKPTIRRNRICDGHEVGLLVYKNGGGCIEDNEIARNRFSGVEVLSGAHPALRRNRIHGGHSGGVFFSGGALGLLEDNEIAENDGVGVEITAAANPTVRRNRIWKNGRYGILIRDRGLGVFEENDIYNNELVGIEVSDPQTHPVIRGNHLHHGKTMGIYVHNQARADLSENHIHHIAKACIEVLNASVSIQCNRVHDGGVYGIYVRPGGRAKIQENHLEANEWGQIDVDGADATATLHDNRITAGRAEGIVVRNGAAVKLTKNKIFDSQRAGVLVHSGASAVLSDNHVRGSGRAGADIHGAGSRAQFKGNHISHGAGDGIHLHDRAAATIDGNRIEFNEGVGIHLNGAGSVFLGRNDLGDNKNGRVKGRAAAAPAPAKSKAKPQAKKPRRRPNAAAPGSSTPGDAPPAFKHAVDRPPKANSSRPKRRKRGAGGTEH